MTLSETSSGFLKYCEEKGALTFPEGGKKLKSGRLSPWFFHSGHLLSDAKGVHMITSMMVEKILSLEVDFSALYYAPYKGLLFGPAVAVNYYNATGKNIKIASVRKEEKKGEGTALGANLENEKILLIDDVLTAGTALKEAKGDIMKRGGELIAMVIILDRQERGDEDLNNPDALSSLEQLMQEERVTISSLLTYQDIRTGITEGIIGNPRIGKIMDDYYLQYGAKNL